MKSSVAALLFVLLASSTAGAQDKLRVIDVMRANLEPSYLVVPLDITGLDPVWYETNIVAHFVAHRPSWPFAVVLTPKVLARLFREHSEPVKTPSYMPRLAVFWWLDRPDDGPGALHYASLAVLHHSNGQAGPTYLPGRKLNHDDGNFNTNYFELALHGFHPDRKVLRWTRLALEWHPWLLQQRELHGQYGSLRLQLDGTVLEHPSIGGSLSASLGVIMDGFTHNQRAFIPRQLERFPVSVAYSVAFEGIEIALFARYYRGRDYYNIWFDRTVHILQLGISSHLAPLISADP